VDRLEGVIRSRALALPLLVLVVVGLVAACASSQPAATARRTVQPASTSGAASGDAGEPSDAASDEASLEPTDEASEDAGTDPEMSPEASDDTALGAAACTGTDDNRTFFEMVASKVKWDVYCAALPAGWHVDTGSYRLASGGRLLMAYKGPNGARIELREGAYCAGTPEECVPDGDDAGPAAFGDRDAHAILGADGSVSIIADAGDPIAWLAVATNVRQSDALDYIEGLVRVSAAP
jgi:hypothetical protein